MWQPPEPPERHPSAAVLPVVLKMPPSGSLAAYVASKVIRHARNMKNIHEDKLWCSDCKLFPKGPVTGRCGHTRCTMCIKRNGACPCGAPPPQRLHSNILVRDIIEKMMSKYTRTRLGNLSSTNVLTSDSSQSNVSERSLIPSVFSGHRKTRVYKYALRSRMHRKQLKVLSTQTRHKDISLRRMFSSPQMRFEYARELLSSGGFRDAAAHLAHVAASSEPTAPMARDLLIQVISAQSPSRDPRHLTRILYQSVRQQSVTSSLDSSSIECPVCYNVMNQPVTTTCGHTFCRCCIKRTMETRNWCPLCSTPLNDFYLSRTDNTEFVSALLSSIAPAPSQIDPNFVPIFACTVAFPDIPCPLMIFDSELRNIIRGVLDSGSRRFGILASLGDDTYANYGTVVEVRDCVLFEDGKSILSTVGISRFRVIEKVVINGSPYARIQEHADIIPMADVCIFELKLLARQIGNKVQQWLPSLDIGLRTDIATCFGPFPEINLEGAWWNTPNGPIWLWWLIAILPIRTEIQMLMLSTKHLSKRMTAVLRTLDAMNYYTYVYRIL